MFVYSDRAFFVFLRGHIENLSFAIIGNVKFVESVIFLFRLLRLLGVVYGKLFNDY